MSIRFSVFALLLFSTCLSAETKWSGNAKAGFSDSQGNSDTTEMRAGFHAERETLVDELPSDLYLFNLNLLYKSSDGDTSKNKGEARGTYKNFFHDKLYWFVGETLKYNAVRDLTFGSHSVFGLGYWIIREENQSFFVSGGVGYQHETYEKKNTTSSVTGTGEITYTRQLTEWLDFGSTSEFILPFQVPDDFTIRQVFSLFFHFSEEWGLDSSLIFDYDNVPVPGKVKLDREIVVTLTYKF